MVQRIVLLLLAVVLQTSSAYALDARFLSLAVPDNTSARAVVVLRYAGDPQINSKVFDHKLILYVKKCLVERPGSLAEHGGLVEKVRWAYHKDFDYLKVVIVLRKGVAINHTLAKEPGLARVEIATQRQGKQRNADFYDVCNVASWDVLNMRRHPSPRSAIVAKIPHNQRCVLAVGGSSYYKSSLWLRVRHNGVTGWTNARFLSRTNRCP